MKTPIIFSLLFTAQLALAHSKPVIYCIPGQGADQRLFKNLDFDTDAFEIRYIQYTTPAKGTSMKMYARELAQQIDTTQRFILIGVSLGGMIATELSEFLQPEQTIIIASAKSRAELPYRYRFQRKFPIYKLVGKRLAKFGAFIMQPLVEPDRKKEKDTYVQMLKDKDPDFLKRTIKMIMEWERENNDNEQIIHIHGNKDRTIPIKNVQYDHLIEDGSHMMTLTRSTELTTLLNRLLLQPN